jgi:phosphate transport system substrate-binding protein
MKVILSSLLVLVMLLSACDGGRDKHGKLVDTPTSGSIKIAADESLRPLVEAEVATFNGIYTKATIEASYVSESEALEALMKDSVRLVVITRRLTTEEKKYLREMTVNPKEVDLAISGIALIVNRANPDTLISVAQLKAVLQGKVTQWNHIGGKSKESIQVVFDSPTSGMVRYLKDSLAKVDSLPANCYAANNNASVVDYVSKNENALGLIGVEWISDKNDSTANSFLEKIKVMGVAGDSTHFQPYQAYMALRQYPLLRKITLINRESRTGLGHGFGAFFASERGQRIVLKAGLVPATMPVRIVEINRKPFEIAK